MSSSKPLYTIYLVQYSPDVINCDISRYHLCIIIVQIYAQMGVVLQTVCQVTRETLSVRTSASWVQ